MLTLFMAAAVLAADPTFTEVYDATAQRGVGSTMGDDGVTIDRVPADGAPWVDVYDITSDRAFEKGWTVQTVHEPAEAKSGTINVGDTILVSVWVRVLQAEEDTGKINISLTTAEPGDSLLWERFQCSGSEWRQYFLSKTATVAADQPRLALHYAQQKQHLQVGPVTLRNYGPDVNLRDLPRNGSTYQGREPDAAWRAAADERIQKLRTRPMTLTVVGTDGQPRPNAEVTVSLKKHSFHFGSAVRMMLLGLDESDYPTRQWTNNTWRWDDAKQYRQIVADHFSLITPEAAFRPNMLENMRNPESSYNADEFRKARRAVTGSLPFLREHDIAMRGHYLSWGAIDHPPQDMYAGKRDEHYAYQKDILKRNPPEVDAMTEGLVVEWDAINHPCGWGETMEALYGGLDMHVEIMNDARKYAPEGVDLVINEGNVLANRSQISWYKRILEYLRDHDVRPDAVGFMAHFSESSLTGIDQAYAIFDDFGQFADKLEITELDISAGADEQLQADYLRDIMTIAFSHPQMDAIVMWGFWENAHWKPETALWRSDWSIKPAGEAYVKLLTETWHTEATATTDAAGKLAVDGAFLGTYEVTVADGGQPTTHTVRHNGEPVSLTVE